MSASMSKLSEIVAVSAHGKKTCIRRAILGPVSRVVHVNYVLEQDEETGWWCASATFRPGVAAFGEGETQAAAIADLRSGVELLLEEEEPPNDMAFTLNVA